MLVNVLAKSQVNLTYGSGIPDHHYHLTIVVPGVPEFLQLILETGYGVVSVEDKSILWTINKRDFLHLRKFSKTSIKQLLELVNV